MKRPRQKEGSAFAPLSSSSTEPFCGPQCEPLSAAYHFQSFEICIYQSAVPTNVVSQDAMPQCVLNSRRRSVEEDRIQRRVRSLADLDTRHPPSIVFLIAIRRLLQSDIGVHVNHRHDAARFGPSIWSGVVECPAAMVTGVAQRVRLGHVLETLLGNRSPQRDLRFVGDRQVPTIGKVVATPSKCERAHLKWRRCSGSQTVTTRSDDSGQ